jgi:uncharacterized protein (DUF2336 family)
LSAVASFAAELEQSLKGRDPQRRTEALRNVTSLFLGQAHRLGRSHTDVFDEVILRLARDIEFKARVELSERLADEPAAPPRCARTLALDPSIEVARPVLTRSAALDDEILMEVATTRTQEHMLAIARRSTLSEPLTDAVVLSGDERVLRTVTTNRGARFSERSFAQLVERARNDAEIQHALHGRSDVPYATRVKLVEIARDMVATTLQDELGADALPNVEAAMEAAADRLANSQNSRTLLNDLSASHAYVQQSAKAGRLNEQQIVRWLEKGNIEDALAAVAHLAGAPTDVIARAYHASSYDPVLILIRAANLGWNVFKAILLRKAGRTPPADVLAQAFDSFGRLSAASAQRTVRFLLLREHQDARGEGSSVGALKP